MTSRRRRGVVALAVLTAVWAALVLVFRSRHQPSIDLVRGFNRAVLNPVMKRMAGRPGFYAAAVHHVGRSTGRAFTTPVIADPVPGGYVIPLPYGRTVDWCKNVLVAGRATIAIHGTTVEAVEPEVVSFDEVRAHVTPRRARVYRLYRIDDFLSVKLPPVTDHPVHRVG